MYNGGLTLGLAAEWPGSLQVGAVLGKPPCIEVASLGWAAVFEGMKGSIKIHNFAGKSMIGHCWLGILGRIST